MSSCVCFNATMNLKVAELRIKKKTFFFFAKLHTKLENNNKKILSNFTSFHQGALEHVSPSSLPLFRPNGWRQSLTTKRLFDSPVRLNL